MRQLPRLDQLKKVTRLRLERELDWSAVARVGAGYAGW